MKDVSPSLAVIRTNETITEAHLPRQCGCLRLFGKETVRAGFDDETLEVFRANYSAQTASCLDEQLFNRRAGLARAG
jgi:hypothetical protein